MSLTQWLKTGKVQTRSPSLPGLPDPADSQNPREAVTVQVAKDAVETLTKSRKRKRGQYCHYDDETRAKIARFAIDSGVAKVSRKFTSELGRNVSEKTVRSMRDQYIKLKKSEGCDSSTLPRSPRGAPMLLGSLDVDVQNWVRQVRLQGGVINARVVMAGAEAIVTKHAKHKLERYGGHITITKHYARSLLRRMGFVKRKVTKNVKQLPSDFKEIKASFVEKVSNVVKQHDIPDALVINWDQTGVQMVPGGDWTMDERGSQQVPITGLDDKRQITLVLAIAKDGTLLPPQLIYAGKTERCLPKCDFPDLWDVTFTESHWSNEESMLRYVDKIIIPYVNSVRDGLPLVIIFHVRMLLCAVCLIIMCCLCK